METLDNNSFNDKNGLNAETKNEFVVAGNWMKTYSITMIILLCLFALVIFILIAYSLYRAHDYSRVRGVAIVPLMLFLGMVVFFIRSLNSLYLTSNSFSNVGLSDDSQNLIKGFKSYRQYWTNLLIFFGIILFGFVYLVSVGAMDRLPGRF
jgi:magnesium-transporting ATPase (P-type)